MLVLQCTHIVAMMRPFSHHAFTRKGRCVCNGRHELKAAFCFSGCRDTAIQDVPASNVHGGKFRAIVTHRTRWGDAQECVTTSQLEGCQAHLVRNITPIRVGYACLSAGMFA